MRSPLTVEFRALVANTVTPLILCESSSYHGSSVGLAALLGTGGVRGDDCREVSGLNHQWRASSNPGTIGRPKSSHIPSQASVAAHPSKHRRAVTPLNSPGDNTDSVSCYCCPSCLLCQSLFNPRRVLLLPCLHFKDRGPKKEQWLPVTFSKTTIEDPLPLLQTRGVRVSIYSSYITGG